MNISASARRIAWLSAIAATPAASSRVAEKEALPKGAKVVALEVQPAAVKLAGRYDDEDSFYLWGPEPPADFTTNYEARN